MEDSDNKKRWQAEMTSRDGRQRLQKDMIERDDRTDGRNRQTLLFWLERWQKESAGGENEEKDCRESDRETLL